MAGSYLHCVDHQTGRLRDHGGLVHMLETGGDVYEAIEELYGMVHFLADVAAHHSVGSRTEIVSIAHTYYKDGLRLAGVQPFDER